jgi:hypothetical protein
MIADLISEVFDRIGHTWKTKTGFIKPSAEDVQFALDRAAAELYTSGVGAQFESGGLIVQKTKNGYDAFVYVGPYQ